MRSIALLKYLEIYLKE